MEVTLAESTEGIPAAETPAVDTPADPTEGILAENQTESAAETPAESNSAASKEVNKEDGEMSDEASGDDKDFDLNLLLKKVRSSKSVKPATTSTTPTNDDIMDEDDSEDKQGDGKKLTDSQKQQKNNRSKQARKKKRYRNQLNNSQNNNQNNPNNLRKKGGEPRNQNSAGNMAGGGGNNNSSNSNDINSSQTKPKSPATRQTPNKRPQNTYNFPSTPPAAASFAADSNSLLSSSSGDSLLTKSVDMEIVNDNEKEYVLPSSVLRPSTSVDPSIAQHPHNYPRTAPPVNIPTNALPPGPPPSVSPFKTTNPPINPGGYYQNNVPQGGYLQSPYPPPQGEYGQNYYPLRPFPPSAGNNSRYQPPTMNPSQAQQHARGVLETSFQKARGQAAAINTAPGGGASNPQGNLYKKNNYPSYHQSDPNLVINMEDFSDTDSEDNSSTTNPSSTATTPAKQERTPKSSTPVAPTATTSNTVDASN